MENAVSETSSLSIELKDGIAVLTLNRPEKRNAVDGPLIAALDAFFAAPPEDARVVVLTGAGDHFCAGLDIAELKLVGAPEAQATSRAWHRTTEKIQFGALPVVAAMKGMVLGGGLEIAASTHVRVAEPSTFYQLPEVGLGIFPGGGASARVSRIVGPGRAVEMMLTARRIAAEEGQMLGLSHHLVGEGEALDTAMEMAGRIAKNPRFANATIINTVPRIADMSIADGLFAESMATALTQLSDEAQTRVKGFLDKQGKG
jgi:enoyl-CoA hydratase/carnithine racemase